MKTLPEKISIISERQTILDSNTFPIVFAEELDYIIVEVNNTASSLSEFLAAWDGCYEAMPNMQNVYKVYPSLMESPYYDRTVDWSNLFYGCKYIVKILSCKAAHIENMTSLCDSMPNLTYVNLDMPTNKSVRYLCYSCDRLEEVHLTNTQAVETAYAMCMYCSRLKTFSGLADSSECKTYFKTFAYCYNLASPININTDSCETMFMTFYFCYHIPSIALTDTAKITNFEATFDNCLDLASISDIDLSSCETAKCLFFRCQSLKSITVKNWSTLTTAKDMFYCCLSLYPENLLELYESFKNETKITDENQTYMMFDCCCRASMPVVNDEYSKHVLYNIPNNMGGWANTNIVVRTREDGHGDVYNYLKNHFDAVVNGHWTWNDASGSAITYRNYDTNINLLVTSKGTNWNNLFKPNSGEITDAITDVITADAENVTDADSMFENCSGLKTVCINNFGKCSSASNMFYKCEALISVKLDTSRLFFAESMFAECSSITNLSLDASHIGYAIGMFGECTSLTNVSLPGLGNNCVSMTGIFHNCTSLKTITLETDSCTDFANAFYDCSSLTEIKLTNTSKIIDFAQSFYGCGSLTKIHNLSFNSAVNMYRTFFHCKKFVGNLKTESYGIGIGEAYDYYRSALSTGKVTQHGDCFLYCGYDVNKGLLALQLIPEDWGGLWDAGDDCLIVEVTDSDEARQSITTNTKISSEIYGSTTKFKTYLRTGHSWEGVFTGNNYIVSAYGNLSSATSCKNMFLNCEKLGFVFIDNLDKCTDLSFMFSGCEILATVYLPDTRTCKTMAYMFDSCKRLGLIDLPNTQSCEDMTGMFIKAFGLYGLTKIILPTTQNVKKMTYMFQQGGVGKCGTIFSKDGLKNCEDLSYMFYQSSAEVISLPFNSDKKCNMTYFAAACSSLTRIYVNTKNASNLRLAFYNCPKLKSCGTLDCDSCENTSEIVLASENINDLILVKLHVSTDLDYCTNNYSHTDLIHLFNNLGTPATNATLEISTTSYNTLSDDEKNIVTSKGWKLAKGLN